MVHSVYPKLAGQSVNDISFAHENEEEAWKSVENNKAKKADENSKLFSLLLLKSLPILNGFLQFE